MQSMYARCCCSYACLGTLLPFKAHHISYTWSLEYVCISWSHLLCIRSWCMLVSLNNLCLGYKLKVKPHKHRFDGRDLPFSTSELFNNPRWSSLATLLIKAGFFHTLIFSSSTSTREGTPEYTIARRWLSLDKPCCFLWVLCHSQKVSHGWSSLQARMEAMSRSHIYCKCLAIFHYVGTISLIWHTISCHYIWEILLCTIAPSRLRKCIPMTSNHAYA